ncbi:hypothetical protein ACU686_10480 [Yinghuangia aomiensis]
MHDQFPVGPGVPVLVHAAAGGTGRTAARWLKRLGATVYGTVGGAREGRLGPRRRGRPRRRLHEHRLRRRDPAG